MQFDRLFSPINIRGMEIKNRSLMPAIHLLYNMDGYANERFNEFYRRRAEGGVGLIIVGGCRFDEYGGSPGMMSLENDSFIPGYKDFTDLIHKEGAKVAVQLYHAGAYAHQIANEGRQALAPSAVFSKFTKEMPKEASVGEIETIIEKMAAAAKRAKEAGFDAVEISASAGYLICQFLSPKTNLRLDEYGGSWENRTRFARQAVSAVRRSVGEDYPILMRISGNDFVPGSNTGEDAVRFARLMEQAGVDMINVTGGWHETRVPQLTGDLPRGGFSYLAGAVKKAVSISVATSNRINDPAEAEKILAIGEADMVSLGRTLIADPDWMNKARDAETDLIRHCVACNQGCLAKTFFAMPVECLVNAKAGREYEKDGEKPKTGKNILVVGAGPAGCEFAIQASQRGHSVTLWEKSDCIGGQLNLAGKVPSKHEFLELIEYHKHMLPKSGVKMCLGKEASAEEIKEMSFDHVVAATGSMQKNLELPEVQGITVCGAFDILSGRVIAGKNVLIIGGGAVGCECAEFIAREAALSPEQVYFLLSRRAETPEKVLELMDKCERKISIIDAAKIGSGFEQGTAWPLLDELDRFGVERYPFAKLLRLSQQGALISAVRQKSREEKKKERESGVKTPEEILELTIPCDTIVVSVGSNPETGLYEELKALGVSAFNIGDSTGTGKVSDAIEQAAKLAGSL
jgi:2,4-dienoyl-CoA reductase (NADPH2)